MRLKKYTNSIQVNDLSKRAKISYLSVSYSVAVFNVNSIKSRDLGPWISNRRLRLEAMFSGSRGCLLRFGFLLKPFEGHPKDLLLKPLEEVLSSRAKFEGPGTEVLQLSKFSGHLSSTFYTLRQSDYSFYENRKIISDCQQLSLI